MKLKAKINMHVQEVDIHAVAGLLKLYLRELPECLLTHAGQQNLLEAVKIEDEDERADRFLEIIRKIPAHPHHNCVRESLMEFPLHTVNVKLLIDF